MRVCVGVMLGVLAVTACAGTREEITPAIVVSPNAKSRIVAMDRLRHHGSVRRWLPHVTVEDVDDDAGFADDEAGDARSESDDAAGVDGGAIVP